MREVGAGQHHGFADFDDQLSIVLVAGERSELVLGLRTRLEGEVLVAGHDGDVRCRKGMAQ